MKLPPPDKVLHFAGGAILASAGAVLAGVIGGLPPWHAAVLLAVAGAFGREAYNKSKGGPWSWPDAGVTVLGALPVVLPSLVA